LVLNKDDIVLNDSCMLVSHSMLSGVQGRLEPVVNF
jgi:hypothetical protein